MGVKTNSKMLHHVKNEFRDELLKFYTKRVISIVGKKDDVFVCQIDNRKKIAFRANKNWSS